MCTTLYISSHFSSNIFQLKTSTSADRHVLGPRIKGKVSVSHISNIMNFRYFRFKSCLPYQMLALNPKIFVGNDILQKYIESITN